MARIYGAIHLRIWHDTDFRALTHTQQYLYWTLIFQPKLNRAGLLEYRPGRWAGLSADMTADQVETTIAELAARGYVVLDEDTDELLVRTYVRNGESWRQPKLFTAVASAADEIESPKLRRVLLAELDRIPVDELSDEPGTNGAPSVRAKIVKTIGAVRTVLLSGLPDGAREHPGAHGPKGYPEGYRNPSDTHHVGSGETLAGRVSDTHPEPFGKGIDSQSKGSGTYVPLPVPVPVPKTTPAAAAAARDTPTSEPAAAAGPDAPTNAAAAAARVRTPPAAAAPLVDALAAEGFVVGWNLTPDQWSAVTDAIARSGIAALIDHARRSHKPADPARYATAWLDGWSSLPPLAHDSPLHPAATSPDPTRRQQRRDRNRDVIAQAAALEGIPLTTGTAP